MRKILFFIVIAVSIQTYGQDAKRGEEIFKQSCTACHSVTAKKESFHAGPAIQGVTKRPGRTDSWLMEWISDPDSVLNKKDPIALQLLKENNNVRMTNMLAVRFGGDKAKIKSAAQDIIAFLKSNDSKSGQ